MIHSICGGGLYVELDEAEESLFISDSKNKERLLSFPNLNLCVPEMNGKIEKYHIQLIESASNHIRFLLQGFSCSIEILLKSFLSHLSLKSTITLNQNCELNRLFLFPPQTELNFFDVVNFRHRHYTSNTWPELLLGGKGCETDTYSEDWQFAPHPSMLMLRKAESTFCLGAMSLSQSFGMYFNASEFLLNQWYLHFGPEGSGLKLTVGTLFESPEFCLFLCHDQPPFSIMKRYTDLLIEQRYIPEPEKKTRYGWHTEPVYCTWMDQGYLSGETVPDELGLQQLNSGNSATEICSEVFIRRTLETIEKERLPFTTILIDDGWQVSRGQWEPHPDRFPNMRDLVEEIHTRRMKAIVWWNWAEIFDDAKVDPEHLAGGGWRNKHGHRIRDYSNPNTQRDYLEPLFYKLLSSDEGCYNLDGIKADFLADKVHPEMPLYDSNWRGEENYCFHLFRMFYNLMRKYKPDACHIGCAGHPYLAEYIDINRTYDVATSNVNEHLYRSYMLKASTPGCPVAFDLHNFIERFEEYFKTAKENGASVHVGNILGMKRDRFSAWKPADKEFYDTIRRGISSDAS